MPIAAGIFQISRLDIYPTTCSIGFNNFIVCGSSTLLGAFVFNVKVGANNLPIPTGTVTFIDQNTGFVFGTSSLTTTGDHGSAVLFISTPANPESLYSILAIYNGIHNSFATSVSDPKNINVVFFITVTTINNTPGSSFSHSSPYSISAHVSFNGSPKTSGTVTFNLYSNNVNFVTIGTGSLNGSGDASVNIPANSTQAGQSYYIQAIFNGVLPCFNISLTPSGTLGTIIHST